ncbi:uncharacterized protein PG998_008496 [Apiospora kogelbergensis]|uniref:uncharacterized protein n=1 Tax=Apiospora kogelbergensis TaxID=1337665 RepID=UPI0031321166
MRYGNSESQPSDFQWDSLPFNWGADDHPSPPQDVHHWIGTPTQSSETALGSSMLSMSDNLQHVVTSPGPSWEPPHCHVGSMDAGLYSLASNSQAGSHESSYRHATPRNAVTPYPSLSHLQAASSQLVSAFQSTVDNSRGFFGQINDVSGSSTCQPMDEVMRYLAIPSDQSFSSGEGDLPSSSEVPAFRPCMPWDSKSAAELYAFDGMKFDWIALLVLHCKEGYCRLGILEHQILDMWGFLHPRAGKVSTEGLERCGSYIP